MWIDASPDTAALLYQLLRDPFSVVLQKDASLQGLGPGDRFAIYSSMNRILSTLHSLDYKALGLSDYGVTDKYVERTVTRWAKQYESSKTGDIPVMEALKQHLISKLPTDEDSKRVSIIHGDFRLDNLIFHPKENRVLAVLDWELSTL